MKCGFTEQVTEKSHQLRGLHSNRANQFDEK